MRMCICFIFFFPKHKALFFVLYFGIPHSRQCFCCILYFLFFFYFLVHHIISAKYLPFSSMTNLYLRTWLITLKCPKKSPERNLFKNWKEVVTNVYLLKNNGKPKKKSLRNHIWIQESSTSRKSVSTLQRLLKNSYR